MKSFNSGKRFLFVVVFSLLIVPAHAATVIWDETIDGDLNGSYAGSFDLIIDVVDGVNILRGSQSWTGSTISTFDREAFTLRIPDGFEVTGLTVQVQNTMAASFGGFEFVFAWFPEIPITSGPTQLGRINTSIVSEDVTYETVNLVTNITTSGLMFPYPSGYLDFFTGAGKPSGSSIAQDWQMELTVSPTAVPLPAGVWLFGCALAALLGLRRRSSASRAL